MPEGYFMNLKSTIADDEFLSLLNCLPCLEGQIDIKRDIVQLINHICRSFLSPCSIGPLSMADYDAGSVEFCNVLSHK